MLEQIEFYLTWLSAIFALIAASLWFKSGTAKVVFKSRPGGMQIAVTQKGEKWDLVETLALQSKWSRNAAFMAGLAAICQSIALSI